MSYYSGVKTGQDMKCIISCEHATNRIPPRFAHLFAGRDKVLSSHQAYDAGAVGIARRLGRGLSASVHLGSISRLLVDLNRSPTNRKSLFTPFTRKLSQQERDLLLQKYYLPYRAEVVGEVDSIIDRGRPVLHISIHSFSPVKSGRVRKADIGLLYDPDRRVEKVICGFLAQALKDGAAGLRVRRNYPYLGNTDGFTSFLRRKYPATMYAGIEIELNQGLLSPWSRKTKQVADVLSAGLGFILQYRDFPRLLKTL